MKERPILFSAPMVRALLAGQKTQTRRALKVQPDPAAQWRGLPTDSDVHCFVHTFADQCHHLKFVTCPYGEPGDRLWVRETWAHVPATAYRCSDGVQQTDDPTSSGMAAVYAAGWERSAPGRWKPSIHMPRWACRLVLEITDVRVQRLQDITEGDAIAESVEPNWCGPLDKGPNGTGTEGWLGDSWIRYGQSVDGDPAYSALESFQSLWVAINGPGTWLVNPWVWALTFRRLEPAHD